MKFVLTIYVCSFLQFDCSPPVTYPTHFDSWYECTLKAHEESVDLLKNVPQDIVEKNRLATKYTCTQAMGI